MTTKEIADSIIERVVYKVQCQRPRYHSVVAKAIDKQVRSGTTQYPPSNIGDLFVSS